MVSVNSHFNQRGLSNVKTKQIQTVKKEDTNGTNVGIPLPRIISGTGTKDNPYVLDGKDDKEDIAYMQNLADKYRKDIYFAYPNMYDSDGNPDLRWGTGGGGSVYPD